jgi:predicted ATPase
MSSHPADDARPGLAVTSEGPSVGDTTTLGHGLTPPDPAGMATTSFGGMSAASPLVTPANIGRYRVLRLLGEGTFGRVWLARDDELQRDVAIKVLFASQSVPADAEAWLTEARALAALDHPHIVPIYDVGRTDDGCVYAVAKFIAGKTLQSEIKELPDQRMQAGKAATIIATLAEALHHAYERGLVHRDVKPANVLMEEATGRIYLADFGLAAKQSGNAAGEIAGTPAYMSPEQASGGMIDACSDLYSLGIIFYELLAGCRPFCGKSMNDLLAAVRNGDFPPLGNIDESLPAELVRICHRALSKTREERYASGQELAADLRAWEREAARRAEQVPTNLPASLSPLIGRDREAAEIQRKLQGSRLVTLTGPGGIGKTRLALDTATRVLSEFPDGVFFVELAPLADPVLVPAAIAQAAGCRTHGQRPVLDELVEWLTSRKVLLALDNFEHLPAASGHVARLLAGAPALKVLATSRAPLRIAGEQEFLIPLLTLPDLKHLPRTELLAEHSAISLFLQRAREVLPAFELTSANAAAVAEVCVRLDGLPLAIELAAARVKVLAPGELLSRLQKSLQVLSSRRADTPERQQTLKHTITWSYDLLSPQEQKTFRRLSVFAGGFELDAAEKVADDLASDVSDEIGSLVDNSLLRADQVAGRQRFSMLETIREFARKLLEASGEGEQLSRRHAQWAVALAETAEPELRGAKAGEFTQLLECEHSNIRAALQWCLADPDDRSRGEIGLRFGGALWRFWCSSGHLREARDWMSRLLKAFGSRFLDTNGAKARYAAGCVEEDLGELSEARRLYEEALQLWQACGATRQLPDAYIALGSVSVSQGDYSAAAKSFQQALSLARQAGERRVTSVALSNLGSVAWSMGNYDQAKNYHEEALAIRRELGNRQGVAVSLTSLGLIASRQDDLQGAKVLYQESLAILRELGNRSGIAVCLNNLGEISYRLGEFESGESMLWEALHIQHEIGDRLSLAYTLESLAAAAQLQGSSEAALKFFAAAEGLRESLGTPLPPMEKASNDQIIQEVRIALGTERFAALWTAAKTTPLERLIQDQEPRAADIASGNRT